MKGCRFADSDCLSVADSADANSADANSAHGNGADSNGTTGTLESNRRLFVKPIYLLNS
jgi:hypothetical protein